MTIYPIVVMSGFTQMSKRKSWYYVCQSIHRSSILYTMKRRGEYFGENSEVMQMDVVTYQASHLSGTNPRQSNENDRFSLKPISEIGLWMNAVCNQMSRVMYGYNYVPQCQCMHHNV